jgi:hypothetical protein
MGGTQSQANTSVITQGGSTPAAANSMKYKSPELEQAYQQGKIDSSAEIQKTLENVAAQVYDNVHEQLRDLQAKQVDHTKNLSIKLKENLISSESTKSKYCSNEENLLTKCLQENQKNAALCSSVLDSFAACASSTLKK